jgi:hypothetical protein
MNSARRLRLLAEQSAYVIAGDNHGQIVFPGGTGLYWIFFRKIPI